jgi:hypothetical protein
MYASVQFSNIFVLTVCFKLINFVFQIVSIHLAWILKQLKFSLIPSIFLNILIHTMVYAALTHNGQTPWLKF